MGFYFDITAPYPGSQNTPYIPQFTPLSPRNDGVTGTGAGQGSYIPPNSNWDFLPKDQKHAFFAIGNRLKDISRYLDNYLVATNRASHLTNRYNEVLNNYNPQIQALENAKAERSNAQESAKRLKDLIEKEKAKKQRFNKELKFFFDFNNEQDNKQKDIFQGLFNRREIKALDLFLTNPYAILPEGVIYKYHNPGSNNYNPLNAFNPMDGINSQFKTNTLNQLNNNSFQRNLAGGVDFNYFAPLNFAKALSVERMVFSFNNSNETRQAWAFFLQNKWYSNGEKLKIINAKIQVFKELKALQTSIKEKEQELENEQRKQDANEERIEALTSEILAKTRELESLKQQLAAEDKIINDFLNYKQSILNDINHSNLSEKLKHGLRDILNDPNKLKPLKDL
ncbi:hypothetical protein [Helicobacter pylori]|uniref:hypothetical protein n=1 Tax=Helicobacter pylori TaxID=210 RepID=UPI000463CF53|nr:hypothetical protein [Helicobacter pylori]